MTDTLTAPSVAAVAALAATIEDGIHPGLNEPTYRALPFANCSLLKILHSKSPKHCRWEMLNPTPPTPAMTFGSAFHCKVLRPDDFAGEWRVSEPCHCGNSGKRIKDGQWVCGVHGRGLADEKDFLTVDAMATIGAMESSLLAHGRCRHYLRGIDVHQRECAIIWTDPETGVRCKAKLDQWGEDEGRIVVPDLKTCEDAGEEGFGWQIANHLYTMQAAFYSDGLSIANGGELVENFQFLAIEKSPPYACCAWKMHQGDIALGRAQYRSSLAKWKFCHEQNVWPGYAGGLCQLPKSWFMNESKRV